MSNIFDSDCEAIVNTVNCVGVMGKGLALQFKQRYPQMYASYRAACTKDQVSIGEMRVWYEPNGKVIINFPTKIHWRNPSQLWFITEGLHDLKRVIRTLGLTSVAIPPLGCGNGGLDWTEVKSLIHAILGNLGIRVDIYPPNNGAMYTLETEKRP